MYKVRNKMRRRVAV